MKIWMDGKIVDGRDARISVTDHGLLYGDGVFEGMRVYGGRDAEFTLYDDDGVSYDYEKGIGRTTRLRWDEKTRALSATGDKATATSVKAVLKVVQ